MTDRELPAVVRRGEIPSPDSTERFHGLLAARSAPVPRRKPASGGLAERRAVRFARLLAGLANFAGGGLVGSGLTLIREGQAPLGPPAALLAAGVTAAVAGLLCLQLLKIRLALPSPPLAAPV